MKSREILAWAEKNSVNFEHIILLDVPSENDEFCPQNEEWWNNEVGGCPPAPIAEGIYLMYYRSQYDEIDYNGKYAATFPADAEIEVNAGEDTIYLIEDY